MNVFITGAEEVRGRILAKEFHAQGHSVCLVLDHTIPTFAPSHIDFSTITYGELFSAEQKIDLFIHAKFLLNPLAEAPDGSSENTDSNVELLSKLLSFAQSAKVERFVNVSSVHVFTHHSASAYLASRVGCAKMISDLNNPGYVSAFLPPLFSGEWTGRLSILNRLPKIVRNQTFPMVAALKPVVRVDSVVARIAAGETMFEDEDWILATDQSTNMYYRISMKVLDLLFCIFVVGLLSWLLLITAVLIKVSSPGPILFRQDRVGKNGKVFSCWKFRTMTTGAPELGTHLADKSYITKVGSILRKTKIDELPQIKNILLNEMSLIGPRPCLPSQTELVGLRQSMRVFSIKPGISGLAQIRNLDMSEPKTLSIVDARYVKLRSIILDVKIMIMTAVGGGQGDAIKEN